MTSALPVKPGPDPPDGPRTADRHPLVGRYLAELELRRPAAVAPVGEHLDDFFRAVGGDPEQVTVLDVLAFAAGRADEPGVVSQLRNVARFYDLMLRNGAMAAVPHPVPARLGDRRSRRRSPARTVIRTPRTLPVLGIATRRALLEAATSARDRAILLAFLLGGLRLGELVGLRLGDLDPAEEHVVVTAHGGSRRIVPVVPEFFRAVDEYLAAERPAGLSTQALFVSTRGRHRGAPLKADGVQEIVARLRTRAGVAPLTPRDLRLACLGALRAAGMSNEALRVFAGQRPAPGLPAVSDDRLIDEYRAATRRPGTGPSI